ncbi:hypothetical protein BDP27DRAFT_1441172 [Rhodocollybia butyracea]|uniref:F-box domain-containing protein n=1 Tax=Rhodocollybia butyracea TaxID=206335 RepID=A0A9P5QD11_9AGAR|nr:hypothetical protein BDP27DRAFT_1441172 [Rhodocollybia butyracea]
MLAQLPTELIFSIISFLDLPCIREFQLVCKSWKHFVDQNESTIYHILSVGFIASTAINFSQLPSLFSPKSLDGVTSWKSFCQRRSHISKSWTGKASSRYVTYNGSGSAVHRIKVDEKAGFIITSFRHGGLIVTDLTVDKVLWSLPQSYVKSYAHLEYGEGFLIFDRLGGSKEVWRLVNDFPLESRQTKTLPDQVSAWENASEEHSDTYPKGHFKPWAILTMPQPTRAFRFVYPTLLVGAWDHAFLYDILSLNLIQTITPIQEPEDPAAAFALVVANAPSFDAPKPRLRRLSQINYVEVDTRHVFICGVNALRIFSRETGRCIFDVPSTRREFGSRKFTVLAQSTPRQDAALMNQRTDVEETDFSSTVSSPRVVDEFIAVHVSSCGRHLVAMLASSRVVVIQNFEHGLSSLYERMIQIQLGSSRSRSKYLAIYEDHVAVATNNGLFLFSLSEALDAKPNSNSSAPLLSNLIISRAPLFGYSVYMSNTTCLQLSDTGLYLNWDPEYLTYAQESLVERERLQDMFIRSLNNQRMRQLRMPTGDLILVLDDEEFLTETSTVCGIDFTPSMVGLV